MTETARFVDMQEPQQDPVFARFFLRGAEKIDGRFGISDSIDLSPRDRKTFRLYFAQRMLRDEIDDSGLVFDHHRGIIPPIVAALRRRFKGIHSPYEAALVSIENSYSAHLQEFYQGEQERVFQIQTALGQLVTQLSVNRPFMAIDFRTMEVGESSFSFVRLEPNSSTINKWAKEWKPVLGQRSPYNA